MKKDNVIVGIDLGTTNSEIAAFQDGQVRVLARKEAKMLPSCVGLSPQGELLVGASARNQLLVYPERTVRSIKRQMGKNAQVALGDKTFSPQEISAFILRELVTWAQEALGCPVNKAVITVPAYFSDAQRNATREAGALAGLDVIRILNEPTAASLAYGFGDHDRRTIMVYDLGGGTFDVSIVSQENQVTEVLASHGNNHLGGDDFDQLLVNHLVAQFQEHHGLDLSQGHPLAMSRLLRAAEEAKKRLSYETDVPIREESLVMEDGRALHLETEISRESYEAMIRPLVESTLDSVYRALSDAGKTSTDLDAILLVGGSTRTPLVLSILEEGAGLSPHQEVDPDLCVALGAGVLASRLAGHDVDRVLVDVTPYSFGPSHLGDLNGRRYDHCYHPIIRRNTALPITRTDRYYTAYAFQREVEINIYQGDDPDALKNILVGSFHLRGLTPKEQANEVLCRMSLDLDGILRVEGIEKDTGKSAEITISNALTQRTPAELKSAQKRLLQLYATRPDGEELEGEEETTSPSPVVALPTSHQAPQAMETGRAEAEALMARSRSHFSDMHPDDKEEAIDLHEQIEMALRAGDRAALGEAMEALKELLFFIEGH